MTKGPNSYISTGFQPACDTCVLCGALKDLCHVAVTCRKCQVLKQFQRVLEGVRAMLEGVGAMSEQVQSMLVSVKLYIGIIINKLQIIWHMTVSSPAHMQSTVHLHTKY